MISPSPTSYLQQFNQRHMINILMGFVEVPYNQFETFEDVANLWMHEVCRTILDRFTDIDMKIRRSMK